MGLLQLITISVPCVCMILTTELAASFLTWVYATRPGAACRESVRVVVEGTAKAIGKIVLRDPRNWSFLPWMLWTAVLPPALLYMVWSRYRIHGFEVLPALLYHFLRLGPHWTNFAHHHTLVHKLEHLSSNVCVGPAKILGHLSSRWSALFYGTIAASSSGGVAHNKIHHGWHNDVDDVHTNIDVDRTQFSSYVLWLPRFLLYYSGVSSLALFLKRRDYNNARAVFYDQVYFLSVGALLTYMVDFKFCLVYFVYPFLESCSFLGLIAYLWHGFVEPDDPTNQYINSITILNGHDNVWNEDYHVVHHHAPHVHWTEVPAYFEKTKAKYAAVNATIFQNCQQGDLLHWWFAGEWDKLAEHFVDLNNKMSHEEKVEMIQRRLSFHKVVADAEYDSWGITFKRNWDKPSVGVDESPSKKLKVR
eukprot:TRINITY_DN38966_c0_g1_i1.p1 TRINITY_DN38966_c0_g1~~TRINITY_DN38966_c0_g1_i1.p1  ORF type:complete len:459 (-),score=64.86 TRINITY_DN38966_c0_g1_i1:69-1325(-)